MTRYDKLTESSGRKSICDGESIHEALTVCRNFDSYPKFTGCVCVDNPFVLPVRD